MRAAARNVPTVRFAAVALFRLAQGLGRRVSVAGSLVKQLNHVLTGCDIAYQASVGPGLVLYHPTGVVIGPACRIGDCVQVGANAVVTSSFGSDVVVAGAPARVVRER
jgi:serine O-acetyltransferase